MNQLKDLLTWLTAPAGAAVLAALWRFYAKLRDDAAERKAAASKEHEEHGNKLQELTGLLQKQLAVEQETAKGAVAESAALRAENDGLRRRVARLENQNDRLTAVLAKRSQD